MPIVNENLTQNKDHPQNKLLNYVVGIISFIFPLTALPQLYNIWILQDTQGVSFWTWFLFLILGMPLFIYAIVNKERKLSIMFGLWVIMYLLAVIGLLLY
tara:strand:+ start:729 stop:1028 length:300 start_codon:yes stop_codon:yes gene_type:complete